MNYLDYREVSGLPRCSWNTQEQQTHNLSHFPHVDTLFGRLELLHPILFVQLRIQILNELRNGMRYTTIVALIHQVALQLKYKTTRFGLIVLRVSTDIGHRKFHRLLLLLLELLQPDRGEQILSQIFALYTIIYQNQFIGKGLCILTLIISHFLSKGDKIPCFEVHPHPVNNHSSASHFISHLLCIS